MKDKICLICQPCGLGDILFIQKICKYYHTVLNFKIILPIIHELEWLSNYIDDIDFVSWGDQTNKLTGPPLPEHIHFPFKEKYNYYNPSELYGIDFVYLNFFHPSMTQYPRIMEGKYNLVGLDYSDWADYLTFNRNIDKENELYYNVLGLKDNEDYIFINKNYQLRPKLLQFNKINCNFGNRKVVEMNIQPGFTLFDWCKVIENASEIHMVETSLNYMMESPQLKDKMKDKKLVLYSRFSNFKEVDYLFKLPWEYK